MYCINCGSKLKDDAKFCINCGYEVNRKASSKEETAKKEDSKDNIINAANDVKERIEEAWNSDTGKEIRETIVTSSKEIKDNVTEAWNSEKANEIKNKVREKLNDAFDPNPKKAKNDEPYINMITKDEPENISTSVTEEKKEVEEKVIEKINNETNNTNKSKDKLPKIVVAVVTLLIISAVVGLVSSGVNKQNNSPSSTNEDVTLKATLVWPNAGLATLVPIPNSDTGNIVRNNENVFEVDVYEVSTGDFYSYVDTCKGNGFVLKAEYDDNMYFAYNNDRVSLKVTYNSSTKTMSIIVETSFKLTKIEWPNTGVPVLVPVPNYSLGYIEKSTDDIFSVYLYEYDEEKYLDFVSQCKELGYEEEVEEEAPEETPKADETIENVESTEIVEENSEATEEVEETEAVEEPIDYKFIAMDKNSNKIEVEYDEVFNILHIVVDAEQDCSEAKRLENGKVIGLEKFDVQLSISCYENLIFSKYNVNIDLDGQRLGTIPHGKEKTFSAKLIEGTHTIVLTSADDSTIKGSIDINVTKNNLYKFEISCNRLKVDISRVKYLTVPFNSTQLKDKTGDAAKKAFESAGFKNVSLKAIYDLDASTKDMKSSVEEITINGLNTFDKGTFYYDDAKVVIMYHDYKLLASPVSSENLTSYSLDGLKKAFADAGYFNVKTEKVTTSSYSNGTICSASIDGKTSFTTNDKFSIDKEVVIIVYEYVKPTTTKATTKKVTTTKATTVTNGSEIYVWIPKSGKKYHYNRYCSNMSNPTQITKDQAIARGFEACKKCVK